MARTQAQVIRLCDEESAAIVEELIDWLPWCPPCRTSYKGILGQIEQYLVQSAQGYLRSRST